MKHLDFILQILRPFQDSTNVESIIPILIFKTLMWLDFCNKKALHLTFMTHFQKKIQQLKIVNFEVIQHIHLIYLQLQLHLDNFLRF